MMYERTKRLAAMLVDILSKRGGQRRMAEHAGLVDSSGAVMQDDLGNWTLAILSGDWDEADQKTIEEAWRT